MTDRLVVGIAGGTASGKSTVARQLAAAVGSHSVAELDLDSYYRDFGALSQQERQRVNWDHPGSVDLEEFADHVRRLKNGESVQKPRYSFTTYSRESERENVESAQIVLVEGLFLFFSEEIRNMIDLKVFVDLDADLRFIRRLQRDTISRGRSAESVIEQYLTTVRPMHLQFVEPSKAWADLILPSNSTVGLETLAASVRTRLS